MAPSGARARRSCVAVSRAGGCLVAKRFENPPDDVIRELLARPRTVAVVGCSPDPARDSHRIARWLTEHGHRVIPVNPAEREIQGLRSYASLLEIPEPIDVVDVFRRAEHVAPIVDQA